MSRLPLYAVSARNSVGRALGLRASTTYTAAQMDVVKILWKTFRTEYDAASSAALLGCVEGECSFDVSVGGDKNKATGEYEARGVIQWHQIRRAQILHWMGIDVWAAGAEDQAKALLGEMSEPWSWYKRVSINLRAATAMSDKMRVLVRDLEQSGMQNRDVARRTPFGVYWLAQNLDAAEVTS